MNLQCKFCGKIMSLDEWKQRRLHGGSVECPKCNRKLHLGELKRV